MRKLLVLSLVLLNGCYSYAPVASAPLPRGTAVRARLSTPTDFRLSEVSVNNTTLISGEVVSQDSDTLVLSAFSLAANTGYTMPAVGETLKIPASRIARIERRRLDVLRSAALTAVVAAAGALFVAVLDDGGSSGGGRRPPTVPR